MGVGEPKWEYFIPGENCTDEEFDAALEETPSSERFSNLPLTDKSIIHFKRRPSYRALPSDLDE